MSFTLRWLPIMSLVLFGSPSHGAALFAGPFPLDASWYSGCVVPGDLEPPFEYLAVASHYDQKTTAEVATEFVADSCAIVGFGWVGWQFERRLHEIVDWTIRIYSDDDGSPGDVVDTWVFGGEIGQDYCVSTLLPDALMLPPGQPYWVSTSARVDGFQWGVAAIPGSARRAMFRGAAVGYPSWTGLSEVIDCEICGAWVVPIRDPECADDSPVEPTSWARLRTVYR